MSLERPPASQTPSFPLSVVTIPLISHPSHETDVVSTLVIRSETMAGHPRSPWGWFARETELLAFPHPTPRREVWRS